MLVCWRGELNVDPMLKSFITESRENIETAGRCFLDLEKEPDNQEILNDLFRAVHTMKGSSGLFEIVDFTKVVHAAEDVLDVVRQGEIELTSEHIDLFLDTFDQISCWLDELENTGAISDDAQSISVNLSIDLKNLMGVTSNLGEVDDKDNAKDRSKEPLNNNNAELSGGVLEPFEWINNISDTHRENAFLESSSDNNACLLIEYLPDSQCFFSGDDPLHTVNTTPGIVWFDAIKREEWVNPVNLDPYCCNLKFRLLVVADIKSLRQHFRYVAEQIQIIELQSEQLVFPTGTRGDQEIYLDFVKDVGQLIEQNDVKNIDMAIKAILQISASDLFQTSALKWLSILVGNNKPDKGLIKALVSAIETTDFNYSKPLEKQLDIQTEQTKIVNDKKDDLAANAQNSVSDEQLKAASFALQQQQKILAMPCKEEALDGRIASISMVIKNLLQAVNYEHSEFKDVVQYATSNRTLEPLQKYLDDLQLFKDNKTDNTSISAQQVELKTDAEVKTDKENLTLLDSPDERRLGERRQQQVAAKGADSAVNQVLRVDQEKIDQLMDLVGELVVAKNALPFLAKQAADQNDPKVLAKNIMGQYGVINRLSEELQSTMMQVRMVPVASVFKRFPRLVRDLSRKLGKDINLVMEGEETEADKSVVENLSDPLIHLVRNSLDHGLENPEQRVNAGKKAEGTLTLKAIPQDDQVIIEVSDDGRGIDPAIIKRKAYEKGLIDEHRLDSITDHEAIQLVLAPGFSTAEQISDLSGRGVGMDVVNSVVSQAGGSLVVNSVLGQGSCVRISLPLSMAVSQVMMIEVNGQNYGVSMDQIVETVKIDPTLVTKIKQDEAIVLRDRIIPLFYLSELLKIKCNDQKVTELAILVMHIGGEEVGLVIDNFHEGIDIIQKPLEGVMANYPYYSGAALLGDGRVLLVLNVKELLACR